MTGGVPALVEKCQAMGIFVADWPATFEVWLEGKLGGLAPGIRAETSRWAGVLHDGGPRIRARDEKTVRLYVSAVRPALLAWSVGRDHLREITREDVLAHVEALHGQQYQTTLVALRSLFAWAKKTGVIFRDPAAPIRVGRFDWPVWQPLAPEQIAQTVRAATTPGPGCWSCWRPCTPPGPARSARCGSRMSTSATAG